MIRVLVVQALSSRTRTGAAGRSRGGGYRKLLLVEDTKLCLVRNLHENRSRISFDLHNVAQRQQTTGARHVLVLMREVFWYLFRNVEEDSFVLVQRASSIVSNDANREAAARSTATNVQSTTVQLSSYMAVVPLLFLLFAAAVDSTLSNTLKRAEQAHSELNAKERERREGGGLFAENAQSQKGRIDITNITAKKSKRRS